MSKTLNPSVRQARGRVAGVTRAVRNGERPAADLTDAKRDLAEANIAAYVKKVLEQAPPLNDEQRTRLAELLRPARQIAGGR